MMKRNNFQLISLVLGVSLIAGLVALALPAGVEKAFAETESWVTITFVNNVGCLLKISIKGPKLPYTGKHLRIGEGQLRSVQLKGNSVYQILLRASCCGKGKGTFNTGHGGYLPINCGLSAADGLCRLDQTWFGR